jgi:hypothetical protein
MYQLHYVKPGIVLALLLGLGGCATMSPEECKVADWRSIGEKDGSQGKSEQLAAHLKSCQGVGVVPDNKLYRSGYQQGLKYYCQPQRILNLALTGNGSVSVCPLEQQQFLTYYYRLGHDVYVARTQVNDQTSEQSRLERELIDKKDLTDLQRKEKRERLRNLDKELYYSREELRRAESRLSQNRNR